MRDPEAAMKPSPFLRGNYAPVRRELEVDDLPVVGAIPDDMDGLFLRNGPNPMFDPAGPHHWFDGDGMIHGVRLARGRASYRNRWVRTRTWELEREAGRALWPGMAEPLRFDLPDGIFVKHTANTALVHHAGRLLALMEATAPYALRAPTLETLGEWDFGGHLRSPFTAHPKVDPATGEMVFIGYQVMPPGLTVGVVSPDGALTHQTEVPLAQPVMMHDFALTPRHVVLLDVPLVFDLAALEAGTFPVTFRRELGARIGVLPRGADGASVRWFDIAPCAVFHTVNAWEEGDEVVLLACRAESTDVLASHLRTDGEGTPAAPSRLHRWRVNLVTGAVREEALDDAQTEFPRVNDRVLGRRHRWAWTARVEDDGHGDPRFDAVVKYCLESGNAEAHAWGRGRAGGEAVFVPRRGAEAEDDGYLVTFVWDALEQRSELVIVDARDMLSRPRARVMLPQRVPFGFHGLWVDGAHLA